MMFYTNVFDIRKIIYFYYIKVGNKGYTFHKHILMPCGLRVNITIVYEHTVCATSAFSVCMLRVVCNVVLF